MTTMNRTIYITQPDMTRLRSLIETMKSSRDDIKTLSAELEQAKVVPSSEIPGDVITMNSKTQVRDIDDDEVMYWFSVNWKVGGRA